MRACPQHDAGTTTHQANAGSCTAEICRVSAAGVTETAPLATCSGCQLCDKEGGQGRADPWNKCVDPHKCDQCKHASLTHHTPPRARTMALLKQGPFPFPDWTHAAE